AQILNTFLETRRPEFLDEGLQFFGGNLLIAVFCEQLLSELSDGLNASPGSDADVDLLISDFLFEASLGRTDIFGDQRVETLFASGFLIENFQKPHASHR